MALTSLIMITKLFQYDCKIRTLHVGGTLEKVEKAMKKMTITYIEAQNKKKELGFLS